MTPCIVSGRVKITNFKVVNAQVNYYKLMTPIDMNICKDECFSATVKMEKQSPKLYKNTIENIV